MKHDTREIRQMIQSKPPIQMISFVRSFCLTPEEESCILLKELHGNSIIQISNKLNCSTQTIIRRRESAFRKIYKTLHS